MRPSRLRDQLCAYPGCLTLVLRESTYCRSHLGILHGRASGRTYSCSAACQTRHQRCSRCGFLCNGGHARTLREGLCYAAGTPSCWSQLHNEVTYLMCWVVTCLLCTRSSRYLVAIPRELRCDWCGSALLEAEKTWVVGGLHALQPRRTPRPEDETALQFECGGRSESPRRVSS